MTTDARESCCSGFPNCIHNQCQTCGGYGKHFRQCLVGELETALAESRDREKEWVDSYSKQTQQLVDSEKQVAALEAKLAEKDREINSFIRDFESDFVMDSGELVDVDHLWSPAVAHYKAMKALRPPTGEGE